MGAVPELRMCVHHHRTDTHCSKHSQQTPTHSTAGMSARVQKEIKRLSKSPPPGISAWPSGDNLMQLSVQMQGPQDTPYEQGLFKLEVCVPQRYPFEPPKVQFQTPVYHPNIDAQGRICLDVLNMPPKGSWGPALDLSKVLMAVRQLLAEPNPKDPLEVAIAEECASQPELFKMKARQHVAQHAKPGAAVPAAASEHLKQQEQLAQAATHTQDEQPATQGDTPPDAPASAAAAATQLDAPASAAAAAAAAATQLDAPASAAAAAAQDGGTCRLLTATGSPAESQW